MTPGKDTSEFKSGRNLIYIGFAVAAFVSLTNLGITPEIAQAKLTSLSLSAQEWTKVLAGPIAAMQVAYTIGRSYVKSKQDAVVDKPEA